MTSTNLRLSSPKTSPALRAFELNPFRVLRLEVNSSTSDAANQAENALTLDRVGLPLDDPDPLPWLPTAGSYELQQAAQSAEEPLVRLKYQLMWFDCVRDPLADLLKTALREPRGATLQEYLKDDTELPPAQILRAKSCSVDLEPIPSMPLPNAEHHEAKIGPPDLSYDLEIGFWEAVHGTDVDLKITHGDLCGACGGSGTTAKETTICPSCLADTKARRTCLRCGCSGRLPAACLKCRGKGRQDRPETLKVAVPAGVRSGTRLRFPGKGEARNERVAPGDLYVTFKVQAHAMFKRSGDDIRIQIPLTAIEAARGAEIEVPTIDGPIAVRFPTGTKDGQNFRIREKGVHNVLKNSWGDQYVEVIVQASEERVNKLRRELAELNNQLKLPSSSGTNTRRGEEPTVRISPPPDHALVARAINQANLRMLVAAATLDRTFSEPFKLRSEGKKIGPAQWKQLDGFLALPEAHVALVANILSVDASEGGKSYWLRALQDWTKILTHPWFQSYVEACIVDLGDDYVSQDDVETIEESIRTHLMDLSAQETRALLLEGRYAQASSLILAMAKSGMDARVITPATRPLRYVLQGELSELESLLEQSSVGVIESVDAYFRRLESIKTRWLVLDSSDVVGLRNLLDDAVEKAYLRLRNLEKPDKNVDTLLLRAANIASAQSLRDRIGSFQSELVEARGRLCHFCKTEAPDYEKSVVLKGKKETGRERHFNTTTIHYAIRYGIVLRCARCARLHDFIRHTGLALWLLGAPGFLILLVGLLVAIFS
jgi:hypothetical protein